MKSSKLGCTVMEWLDKCDTYDQPLTSLVEMSKRDGVPISFVAALLVYEIVRPYRYAQKGLPYEITPRCIEQMMSTLQLLITRKGE